MLRPPELGSGSSSAELPQRAVMPQGMGRTVIGPEDRERGGPKGRTVEMRIGAAGACAPLGAAARGGSASATVEDLVSPARGVSSLASLLSIGAGATAAGGGGGGPGSGAAAALLDKERKRANELERQVEVFQRELGRAANVNEAMWKKVVDSALSG